MLEGEDAERASEVLHRTYDPLMRVFDLVTAARRLVLRGPPEPRVHLAITLDET